MMCLEEAKEHNFLKTLKLDIVMCVCVYVCAFICLCTCEYVCVFVRSAMWFWPH